MELVVDKIKGREPLRDYPWQSEVDRLLHWLVDKDAYIHAFAFDIMMSAAYIDATSGIEHQIEHCDNIHGGYNAHLGFINLCAPCYLYEDIWVYQKAAKPQSGVLGKLSSELILRFIEKLYPQFSSVLAVGGSEVADAILKHEQGFILLAEVKSAPLLTYPFLFSVPQHCIRAAHEKLIITNSQLRECASALFLHNVGVIHLGKLGSELWPFKALVDFIVDESNVEFVQNSARAWLASKDAYIDKNRQDKLYYLANASGNPPRIARERDGWPPKVAISDSKTSVGMDRTDDIKKGIYQSFKIGARATASSIKTAIISNLPAYRHGAEYVYPFVPILWGFENDLQEINDKEYLERGKLRRAFDCLITLEESIWRGLK